MKKLLFLLLLISCHVLCVETIDENELIKLPKAELHLHLGGAYPIEYLKSIASPKKFNALLNGINQLVKGINYDQSFFVFKLIRPIIKTHQHIEDGTFALCKSLQADGVEYVELRTGLRNGSEEYLQAVLRGIERSSHSNFKAKILLSIKRFSCPKLVQSLIDIAVKYKDKGVVGIEISSNSTIGDVTPLIPLLTEAKKRNLSIVVHMGESPLEKDQMILLQSLQPSRIGHGVYLKPEALTWIKKHKVPVEVCLSSAVHLKLIKEYGFHPGLNLYRQGHPVVICTDDPLIFQTTLTKEYMHFAREMNISMEEIKDLALQSFSYRLET